MRLQEPNYNWFHSKLAKQCALIAVDEILTEMSDYFDKYDCTDTLSKIEYWTQVKQEINNL
jgi:hypothetical protein